MFFFFHALHNMIPIANSMHLKRGFPYVQSNSNFNTTKGDHISRNSNIKNAIYVFFLLNPFTISANKGYKK